MTYQYVPQAVYYRGREAKNYEINDTMLLAAIQSDARAIQWGSPEFEERYRVQTLFSTQGQTYPYLKNKQGLEVLAFKLDFNNIEYIEALSLDDAKLCVTAFLEFNTADDITNLDRTPQSLEEQVALSLMPHINLNPVIGHNRQLKNDTIFARIIELCPEVSSDKTVAQMVVKHCLYLFEQMHESIKSDLEFLSPLFQTQPYLVSFASDSVRSNPEVFKSLLGKRCRLEHFAPSICENEAFALDFFKQSSDFIVMVECYQNINDELKKNWQILDCFVRHPEYEKEMYKTYLLTNLPSEVAPEDSPDDLQLLDYITREKSRYEKELLSASTIDNTITPRGRYKI